MVLHPSQSLIPDALKYKPVEEPKTDVKPLELTDKEWKNYKSDYDPNKHVPVSGMLDRFLGDVLSDKSSAPYLKRHLTSQDPAWESFLPESSSLTKEPETYWGGFAKGLYDWAREGVSAAGLAGLIGETEAPDLSKPSEIRQPPAPPVREEPLPIRRSVRTDLPFRSIRDTTPQQDAVAIAQTRDNIPRTAANISTETGIPQPSVRRTLSELEKKRTTDQERLPTSDKMLAKTFADEVSVKQADKLARDPYEFAGDSIRQPEATQRDFGYSEADSAGTPRTVEPLPADVPSVRQEQAPTVQQPEQPRIVTGKQFPSVEGDRDWETRS